MSLRQWVDGELLPAGAPSLAADLPGVVQGIALFETLGAWGGRLPLWSWHLARLRRSAEDQGLSWLVPDGLQAAGEQLLDGNDHRDGVLRILLCPGLGRLHWVLTTRPRGPLREPWVLHPAEVRRSLQDRSGGVKTTSRLLYHLAATEAERAGADEALILGPGDELLETVRGNLFFARDGALCTPATNGAFLPGVGRGLLLESLHEHGLTVAVQDFVLDDLRGADRLWVVNSVRGALPAVLPDLCPDFRQGNDPLRNAWTAILRGLQAV